MTKELRFDGKVAIVTGAGNGLGRSHALLLASRGAKVVVNDLGTSISGGGRSSAAADAVVKQIKDAGGTAIANYDSVEDGAKIVEQTIAAFGKLDILINNAGVLRDVSFHKMTQEDWDIIYRVHVLGSFRLTHAAWPHMRDQGYGRIIMTASAAGIYGNFGQANYSMAKLGLLGFANTLAVEGAKKNVFANTIAPIAGSRLTETVLPKEVVDALKPEYVSPLVAWLCHESCEENGGLFEVGGGFFSKLRWERTKGVTFRLGRPIKIEDLESSWKKLTDFTEATHPASVTESMAPVMQNLQSGPSRGGNEFIDVDQALGYEMPPVQSSYDERDLAMYALGVGAAQNALDPQELRHVYELHGDGFQPLPSYAVVPAVNAFLTSIKDGHQAPGLNFGLDRLLHGEQYTEIMKPLPTKARLTHRAKVKDIFDKGKNALVVIEVKSYDDSNELLALNELTALIRGAGGFGGDRGPSSEVNVPPDRKADQTITEKIGDNQALLYRLSGDWNPLHADPSFASAFGFPRPILHGLCTFGYAARHVIKSFAGGDARLFKSIKVRFAESVFPGETLVTEMWKESPTRVVFRCSVKEREKVVISNAAIELFPEVPKPKAKAAAQPATSAEPSSADIFVGIGAYVAENAGLVQKVGKIFQFKLSAPESTWTLDLKNGNGKLDQGATQKPDCTLELSDADFMAMSTGKADPQQLYFSGKLKISGDVMASQKLTFLKKVDPNKVLEAMKKRTGGAPAAAPAAAAPSAEEATVGDVFAAMKDYVERNKELVAKVQNVYLFKVTSPDSQWTLDLKNGSGSVLEGAHGKADCTLEISSADLLSLTTGKVDPQKLYFQGKLKITGNVMASQKLTFLQKMDPEQAKAAALKARAEKGTAAPATAAPSAKKAEAPALFERLGARIAKSPELVKEVQAVLQFEVLEPEGSWVVDLKNGAGSVKAGRVEKPDTTFRVKDEDLVDLVRGNETAKGAYQKGKLRVDGDVRVAQRLGFLKGL
jgi:(3R)-3-hydroxyacyl-CoA dehydrogenase / 3a,7a,12a-trihydroxy-5b-cholest-24-enoyl-CoA hydratase / enoyl-CoA hydratase 2